MSARAEREKALRYLVVDSAGKVNHAHPNAVEYELLVDLRLTYEALVRERELWRHQSSIIRALAAEVPDEVRQRVLAPLAALSSEDASRPTGDKE